MNSRYSFLDVQHALLQIQCYMTFLCFIISVFLFISKGSFLRLLKTKVKIIAVNIVKALNMFALIPPRAVSETSNKVQDRFIKVCVKIGIHKLYFHSTNNQAKNTTPKKVIEKIPINSLTF